MKTIKPDYVHIKLDMNPVQLVNEEQKLLPLLAKFFLYKY